MCDINDIKGYISSPYLDKAYLLAILENEPTWLSGSYILSLHKRRGVLPEYAQVLADAAEHIKAIPKLALLTRVIYHILGEKEPYRKAFTSLELPKHQREEDRIAYDCFLAIAVCAHLESSWLQLERRGVEAEVIRNTLLWLERLLREGSIKNGRTCLDKEHFAAYSLTIYVKHLMIGRLRFEIEENAERPVRIYTNRNGEIKVLMDSVMLHKSGNILGTLGYSDGAGAFHADITETDTEYVGYTVNPLTDTVRREAVVLKKSEWRELYRKGDTLIKIHIPYGGRLDKELCQNAYARARDIFKRCFSEYDIRGFTTCCWMLSPELSDILAPDANIIAFKKDYTVFPALSSGMDVFLYVYGIEAGDIEEIDIEALPDDNTLRRGIKEKLKSGLYINQFNGYMPL